MTGGNSLNRYLVGEMGNMNWEARTNADQAVVEAQGEIARINDCIRLTKELKKLLEGGYQQVVLDLTLATFVSASFCGFLISVSNRAKELNSDFCVVIPKTSTAYDMLRTVRLDTSIQMYASLEEVRRHALHI